MARMDVLRAEGVRPGGGQGHEGRHQSRNGMGVSHRRGGSPVRGVGDPTTRARDEFRAG